MKEEATQMILQGTQLEIEYARDTMPRGVLGMNAAMMEDYLKFIANRRLSQIGLKEEYPGTTNPFPWMSEIMDLKKEKNFFETRVIEYQTGDGLPVIRPNPHQNASIKGDGARKFVPTKPLCHPLWPSHLNQVRRLHRQDDFSNVFRRLHSAM
eukprot:gene18601-22780_t